MSVASVTAAESNPRKPLVYKTTPSQLGDAFRRGVNRTAIDRQQRKQSKALRLRRTALRVLRDKDATNAEKSQARDVLHEPWMRVSKWANRVARADAREGKHEERLAKNIKKVRDAKVPA